MQFTITPQILENISQFFQLHARLYFKGLENPWNEELQKLTQQKIAVSATASSKPQSYLNASQQLDQENYVNTLKLIPQTFNYDTKLNEDLIQQLQKSLNPSWQDDSEAYGEIGTKLYMLCNWYNSERTRLNSIILAAIAHMYVAEVYPDTNSKGTLSRVVGRGALFLNSIDSNMVIPIEDFFLQNRERYITVLDEAINTRSLIRWIELYTEGLLFATKEALKTLSDLSGGTIDLLANRIISLSPREKEVLDIIVLNEQASGAEIAKKLGVTRQNINLILHNLFDKGLLERIGESTSCRYKVCQ